MASFMISILLLYDTLKTSSIIKGSIPLDS